MSDAGKTDVPLMAALRMVTPPGALATHKTPQYSRCGASPVGAWIRDLLAGISLFGERGNVRAIHRSCSEGHGSGQPRSPKLQPRVHRHRTHPSRFGEGGVRRRGARAERPRRRSEQGPARGREARQKRSPNRCDGQAAPDPTRQEGHPVRHRGSVQPRPQLRRHRACAAWAATRAGRPRRPGPHQPEAND